MLLIMRIEDTELVDEIQDIIIFEHGNYYFFEDFIISEISEGYNYNWEAGKEVTKIAQKHYGKSLSICYISNRVNNYSVKPTDWMKFFKSNYNLNGYAIVAYTETGWFNAIIEKLFFPNNFERFTDLREAINWAKKKNLELNTNKAKI